MNPVHLHLLLNHAPIMGYAIGLFFLLYGYIVKSPVTRSGALWLFLLLTPVTLVVSMSGENSEHKVEELQGVNEEAIETHEDPAGGAVVCTWILGAISLVTLILQKKNKQIQKWGTLAALVMVLVTSVWMGYAGYVGGQIRHTEIHPIDVTE